MLPPLHHRRGQVLQILRIAGYWPILADHEVHAKSEWPRPGSCGLHHNNLAHRTRSPFPEAPGLGVYYFFELGVGRAYTICFLLASIRGYTRNTIMSRLTRRPTRESQDWPPPVNPTQVLRECYPV